MFQLLLAVIYLAFISLGLPDSVLGSAWPTIYPEFNVPVSYAGIIYGLVTICTIFSSLQSDRLNRRFGTGKVTAFSVLLTAVALFGFSICSNYWMMILWTIPYGLGAGSIDAALNNYVALHYKSWHMSWLHCMWGVGASVGPYIMSFALAQNRGWRMGYRYISWIQIALTVLIIFSLPLWKKQPTIILEDGTEQELDCKALTLPEIFAIKGVKPLLLMFFCYCALEQTAGLWASSYLVLKYNVNSELAASFGCLFFLGITIGRALSGFISMKLDDDHMIRLGQVVILFGLFLMFLPFDYHIALFSLVVIGLGCAPIYPCIIHSTPTNFGPDKSQALIGVQMASAYTGNLIMAPLFGIIANHIGVGLYPFYLFVFLVVMYGMHKRLLNDVTK